MRRRRGLTLLELIVVVVVLGVLAALALPTYNMVGDRVRERAAEHSLTAVLREAQALAGLRGQGGFEVADLEAAVGDLSGWAPGVQATGGRTLSSAPGAHSSAPGLIHGAVSPSGAAQVGVATRLVSGGCVLARAGVVGAVVAWSSGEDLGADCDATTALAGPDGSVDASTLQAILDATPPGGVATFPGGVVNVSDHTRLVVPHSMRIEGNNTVLRIGGTAMPAASLIDADALEDGSLFEVADLVIEGPDTTGWDTLAHNNYGAISWQRAGTWNSTMRVDSVIVTGGYGTGVLRAGGGRLEVTDSQLSGWVDAIAFFESHGGSGSMLLADTDLVAPAVSKYSSVGMYIHPHLVLEAYRVDTSGWGRFGIYFNGTPPSGGTHVLEDVTATNNALIQTGSGATTVLRRCSETGVLSNGGSFIKGELLAEECSWSSNGMLSFLPGTEVERRFVDNIVTRSSGTWAAFGASTTGTMVIEGGAFFLSGAGTTGVKLVGTSSAQVTVSGLAVSVTGSGFSFKAEGGVVTFVGMAVPASASATPPGVLVAG